VKTLLAFATIYFVWGSTFLAIRIGVAEVPPFMLAAMRFLAAGSVLYLWSIGRGDPPPDRRQWTSVALLAILIFVVDYGLLFWAEQRVPSGIAAVLIAISPTFTALAEIVLLGTQRLTLKLALALLIGTAGVAVLMSRSLDLGGPPVDQVGAAALIVAALGWSVAAALAKKVPLPASRVMSSGSQMLVGGVFLALASVLLGEWRGFDPGVVSSAAWLALLYLIVPGAILAFTAYVWLLHRESPTKVGTFAYVNPVVAVLLGYFAAGESLGLRTVVGTICVLISVVLITAGRSPRPISR
jgi:drug/metabolite transporter (DMT)-like permease